MRQYRVLTGTIRGKTPSGKTQNVNAGGIVLLEDEWIRKGLVHPSHVEMVRPGTEKAPASTGPKDYSEMSFRDLKAEFDEDLAARFAGSHDGKAHYRAKRDDLIEFLEKAAAEDAG